MLHLLLRLGLLKHIINICLYLCYFHKIFSEFVVKHAQILFIMDYLLLVKYKSKVFLIGFSSDYQEINDIYLSVVHDAPFDYYLISKDLINLK